MLPISLLEAISARPRGRVAIITGAGCSVEKPTELPTAKAIALEAHERLLVDGVLNPGECANPADLSCVADAVFAKTGEQTPLVQRMHPQAFRSPEPNEGYLLAAALLREQAVVCLMTLNFDYAIAVALSQLGAKDSVAVIHGPEGSWPSRCNKRHLPPSKRTLPFGNLDTTNRSTGCMARTLGRSGCGPGTEFPGHSLRWVRHSIRSATRNYSQN